MSPVQKKYTQLNLQKNLKFATKSIRSGYVPTSELSHGEPLHLTSAYHYESSQHAANLYTLQEEGYIYTRLHNPTTAIFEERMAALENTEAALATATGMAAINLTFLSLLESGDKVVCAKQVYGGTEQLLSVTFEKFGIKTIWVDGSNLEDWQKAVEVHKPKIVFFETPTNPTLTVIDIQKIAEIAKENHATSIVDNTIATPALQNPSNYGIDIIIHSATKYIDGQGRAMGGVICGKKDFIDKTRTIEHRNTGASISPFNSWLFLKGLETLEIRMERHSQNALVIAEYLESHPRVKKVNYPFLKSNPEYELAKKQQKAGTGLLSFEVDSYERGKNLIDKVKLISLVGNLGDTKTIVGHPASTSHQQLGEEKRQQSGISSELVRLSVGLEDPTDLIEDLEQALEG